MEIWKDVVGYEGLYEVSDIGNVRGVPGKKNKKCGTKKPKLVKGYLLVRLWRFGTHEDIGVHTLVAKAYIGDRPDGMFCCHNDGDRMNNHFLNLRWDTPKSNSADRVIHGTHIGGERNGRAVLTEKAVREIKKRIQTTHDKLHQIAADFGVCVSTISHIKNGRIWAGVEA